jgi:hypothetical protein
LTSSPCTMVRQNSKLSKVHGSKIIADLAGAKTKQPTSCLGKSLPPAKYSTYGGRRSGILLTLRVEQVTFGLKRTPGRFIAKRVALPTEPHLHVCSDKRHSTTIYNIGP